MQIQTHHELDRAVLVTPSARISILHATRQGENANLTPQKFHEEHIYTSSLGAGLSLTQKIFTRDATGLTRQLRPIDLLFMALLGSVFQLTAMTVQFPFYYGLSSGANLPLALAIIFVPFVILMLVYWAMGITMPRTGNDYVWVSRVTHPSLGFAWSALIMLSYFGLGFVGSMFSFTFGVSSMIGTIGFLYNNQGLISLGTFLSTNEGAAILAIVLLVIFALVALFGSRWVQRIIYISVVASLVALILYMVVLGTTSPTTFAAKWDAVFSNDLTYNGAMALATKNGWTTNPVLLSATLASLPFAFIFPLGGNGVTAVAGEIKNFRRAIPIALLASISIGLLTWAVTATITIHATGQAWMDATGYLYDNGLY